MSRLIIAVVAPVCLCCTGYLLLSPMDRLAVYLQNTVGKLLFPKLDPYRRHRKLSGAAALILVVILTAGIIYFIMKLMNRTPGHH